VFFQREERSPWDDHTKLAAIARLPTWPALTGTQTFEN
jgi:hypothetical protein